MINLRVIQRFFHKTISIRGEEDKEITHEEIINSVAFTGSNLWLLVFAMIIACVGLNVNSVSSVIGAMLISPLMSPIISMGYALSSQDNNLLKISIQNWLRAVFFSVIASTIYFILTPFQEVTTQILSFSKPTIYDVIVAFFGGLAGFIGIIKKDGSKIIAGVAIATACMPPLCSVGFGIATLDFYTIIGALYFYLINCFFIGLATYILARYMNFKKPKEHLADNNKLAYWFSVGSLVMLLPSIYIAWTLAKENNFKHQVESFIQQEINTHNNSVITKDIIFKQNANSSINLQLSGSHLDSVKLKNTLKNYKLKNTNLKISYIDDFDISINEMKFSQIRRLTLLQEKKLLTQDSLITSLQKQLNELKGKK